MATRDPDQNYNVPAGYGVPPPPGPGGIRKTGAPPAGQPDPALAKLPKADTMGPPPPGFSSWAQYYAYIASLQKAAGGGGYGAGGGASSAAELAEKKREFDITTQRDIAKENAAEVDALQKMLAGLSGPKDVYADLFFSHGFLAPQGYKPAPVPLTKAQTDAYKSMGVNQQQLQEMITGTGQPGADTGYLGNLGSSLQPQPGTPGFASAQAPTGQQVASNPTVQGGQLYGKAPAGTTVAPPTPSMAFGGEVPGEVGEPQLAVLHGGEQVDNNTEEGQLAPMTNTGVHPAIQKLMDALSELLANPDFQQFAGVAGQAAGMGKKAKKGTSAKGGQAPQPPAPAVTSGGVQAAALGGGINETPTLNPQPPVQPSPVVGGATPSSPVRPLPGGSLQGGGVGARQALAPSGAPQAGAQGVISRTGAPGPVDNPILALSRMDPYTRALYDIHGRLHPYSAQQWQQMGPQGQDAVLSYVGKVEGANPKAYQDLADRLRPIGAPEATGTNTGGGFRFG
jgi:hypothetical protein